jgi:hypothetical protein
MATLLQKREFFACMPSLAQAMHMSFLHASAPSLPSAAAIEAQNDVTSIVLLGTTMDQLTSEEEVDKEGESICQYI